MCELRSVVCELRNVNLFVFLFLFLLLDKTVGSPTHSEHPKRPANDIATTYNKNNKKDKKKKAEKGFNKADGGGNLRL